MKINKLILSIFIATTTLFIACEDYIDTEVQSPTVSDDNPAVRFADDNVTEYELEPTVQDIKLTVIRDGSESAIEVPITVIENTDNSFDIPASLSFAVGQDTVILTLSINNENAPLGKDISIAIKFGEEYSNPYLEQYSAFHGIVTILNWQPFANGDYYSMLFDASWPQELYKAEGTDKYRLHDLYNDGYHFSFSWDGGAEILPAGPMSDDLYVFDPGLVIGDYGAFTALVDGDPTYTFYDEESDSFTIDMYWMSEDGSIENWLTDTYTISERY